MTCQYCEAAKTIHGRVCPYHGKDAGRVSYVCHRGVCPPQKEPGRCHHGRLDRKVTP